MRKNQYFQNLKNVRLEDLKVKCYQNQICVWILILEIVYLQKNYFLNHHSVVPLYHMFQDDIGVDNEFKSILSK